MKFSHVMSVAGIAVLAALAPAAAAAAVPSPSALTVKVGGSIQNNGSGTSGLAAGVDYVFHPASTLEPFAGSIYADLLGSSIGAGLAIHNTGPLYAGAGLGVYSVSADSQTASGVGAKVFGGFEIAPHTTLELGYHFLPQVRGMSENTATLQLGIRF